MASLFHESFDGPGVAVEALAARVPGTVLVLGPMGAGKSTLCAKAADAFSARGARVQCIGADPGTPAFGPPGCVSLAARQSGGWSVTAIEPLCTLDAARFRLPLLEGVRSLLGRAGGDVLLLDAPGVVRGVAGAELLVSLAGALRPALLVWLAPRQRDHSGLVAEIASVPCERWRVTAARDAARPNRRVRDGRRTASWDAYALHLVRRRVPFDALDLLGTPPPRDRPTAWPGRLVAAQDRAGGRWLGEVLAADPDTLELALPAEAGNPQRLTVRDAGRDGEGALGSMAPVRSAVTGASFETAAQGPGAEVGPASVSVVNGVFGDPLVHLRLRHRRRSLLFDLGDCGRLPTRVLHQVTDVFISHAHADHIGGFVGFLRARIGFGGPCRIHGPPGLAGNIEGFVRGIHWDRIGDRAPEFTVTELHGTDLQRYRVRAGEPGPVWLDTAEAADGILLEADDFRVRGATLDHGTPVLAFVFEPRAQANVRKERLAALALQPGPWLTQLKRAWLGGRDEESIELPDGTSRTAGDLADALLVASAGRPVVYATDLADTPANRRVLATLARGAHTLICESPFLERDAGQARYTGHLTARACGEIATEAGVRQLLPFHFSPRYEAAPDAVYAELAAACSSGMTIRR